MKKTLLMLALALTGCASNAEQSKNMEANLKMAAQFLQDANVNAHGTVNTHPFHGALTQGILVDPGISANVSFSSNSGDLTGVKLLEVLLDRGVLVPGRVSASEPPK